ncbi:MAG: hypothetical protein CR975_03340 [Gammaproteobacteria bacterium]|nr:MAG: hypothetical protein CR975_03340 [Gammaproteobacteria bacterium]
MRYIMLLGFCVSVFLSSCGFQLRGVNSGQLSEQFKKTYLSETEKSDNNDFYQLVEKLIIASGGRLSDKDSANVTVLLSPVTMNSRQIALVREGLLKEYERTYKVTVTILDANNNAQLGSRVITTVKDIQLNDKQVLAGEEQIRITDKEAYHNLAQSILLYLQAF